MTRGYLVAPCRAVSGDDGVTASRAGTGGLLTIVGSRVRVELVR